MILIPRSGTEMNRTKSNRAGAVEPEKEEKVRNSIDLPRPDRGGSLPLMLAQNRHRSGWSCSPSLDESLHLAASLRAESLTPGCGRVTSRSSLSSPQQGHIPFLTDQMLPHTFSTSAIETAMRIECLDTPFFLPCPEFVLKLSWP